MEVATAVEEYSASALKIITEVSAVSFIALAFFIFLFMLGLRNGKHLIVSVILSLYLGFLMYVYFPYSGRIIAAVEGALQTYVPVIIFLVFAALSYLVIRNIVSFDFADGGGRQWLESGLLSLSATLLLAAIVFSTFSLSDMTLITPTVTAWVSDRAFFFWWLTIPLAIVHFTNRR